MRLTPTLLLILLVLTACGSGSSSIATQTPMIGITPVRLTPDALNPTQPASIPSDIPSAPVVSCPQAPPTRLIIQGRGRVTDDNDETLNLRNGPGISFDILFRLDPLDHFTVIDGPECAGGFAWFRVRHRNFTGWIAEGDAEEYYVEPHLAG